MVLFYLGSQLLFNMALGIYEVNNCARFVSRCAFLYFIPVITYP